MKRIRIFKTTYAVNGKLIVASNRGGFSWKLVETWRARLNKKL